MIFTFWEGEKPSYIELCMETWKFSYKELNYNNLGNYTDLPSDILKGFTLAQVADWVRVHVLRDNGGYWIDADTIILTDNLPDVTILGYPETRQNTIGMLHTDAHSEMFTKWAEYQDNILQRMQPPQIWSIMGNDFTDDYLLEHTEIEIGEIDRMWPEVYMIGGNSSRMQKYIELYFKRNYYLSDICKTDMLMLHNSWTPQWYKALNRDDILSVDCTLSNILREAT